jgi:hypothetical protein
MANLDCVGSKYLGGRDEVVCHCNRQNFEDHQLLQLAFGLLVSKDLLKLRDRVLFFVCQLPPVGTQLRQLLVATFLQAVSDLAQFVVNTNQTL